MTESGTQIKYTDLSEQATICRTTDWDRDSEQTLVAAVISAVADAANADPLDLTPLNATIDPEALNSLSLSRDAVDASVTFQYAGYDITIRGDGTVTVQDAAIA